MNIKYEVLKNKYTGVEGIVEKKTKFAAGYDVINTGPTIIVKPGQLYEIPLGIKIQPEMGYYTEVYLRSSLAKRGLALVNSVGILDYDYRGECKLIVTAWNFAEPQGYSGKGVVLESGERVAQIIPRKEVPSTWIKVDKVDDTERGDGAFGSTGK